jgi:hypothetical protein
MKDLLITLLGTIAITSLLFCKKETVEHYVNVARSLKRQEVADIAPAAGGQFFSIPPNWQSNIAPRFSNVNYGANIQYSIPNVNKLAADPTNPLSQGGCGGTVEKYVPIPANSAQLAARGMVPSSAPVQQALFGQDPNFNGGSSSGPVGVYSGKKGDGAATIDQPIVYDRFNFANLKSKYSLGGSDLIRGDIPIVPNSGDWFIASSNPLTDLRQGAMTIMGGAGNSTDLQLKALQAQYSAGMLGQNDFQLSVNPSLAQKAMSLVNAQGDIQVTAFP